MFEKELTFSSKLGRHINYAFKLAGFILVTSIVLGKEDKIVTFHD